MSYMRNAQSFLKNWIEGGILTGFTDLTIGIPLTIRTRQTIAVVNAGATLLPALVGFGYRLLSAQMIAIGGAAAAVTTVDILGTLTASRKLCTFAQASLTQSTLLTMGGTGTVILADGASYTRNDINTAITINITGIAITTAVSIDSILTYVIEPEALQ